MDTGFWKKLKKPFFALAPMADVTDAPFRRIIAKYGKLARTDGSRGGPDVMWTEFVSADGLVLAPKEGKKKLLKSFLFTEKERPIVAQIFSSNPERIEKAAAIVRKLGFDGLDINMGCPDKAVEKQGAGAALIKNPKLAREIIRAAKAGAKNIPVSVKTRIGYKTNEIETWLPELLAEEPAAITIHARTRKEMSDVPARWEMVSRAVEIRNELKSQTLIIGNGDVRDLADAKKKAEETGADGIMLGRAIFGNPWLFSNLRRDTFFDSHGYFPAGKFLELAPTALARLRKKSISTPITRAKKTALAEITIEDKLKVLLEHALLFEKLLSGTKNFSVMKKHFKAYVSGFDGAADLRGKLMETNSAGEVKKIISAYLKNGSK